MRTRFLLTITAALGIGAAALAQNPAPTRVRGTIEAVDGPKVTIATREGPKVTVALAEPVTVMAVKPVELATIMPGSFVGIAAQPGQGGALQAQEVLVFPEAMRGVGEGQYAWDLTPGSSMTNATVSGAVQGASGRVLDLSYKGGAAKIAVPPGTPVVTLVGAEPSDVKPGTPVFLIATKQPDGSLKAARITVGKYGVPPPM